MIKIGRPIEGITINGLEWLLTDNGEVMLFQTTEAAKNFLKKHGYTEFSDDELEESFIFQDAEVDLK